MSKKVDRLVQKSGLVKKEIWLLEPFVREPWKGFTVSDLKQATGNKSHHYVFDAMKKLAASGILKGQKIGNAQVYSVDYESMKPIPLLCFAERLILESRKDIPVENAMKIIKKIKNPYFSFLIGGSYATGKQRPESDLDIAIIVPDSEKKKEYEIILERTGELIIPKAHGFVFTREEFFLMLTNKEFNYGKEIARKHIIVHGAEAYFEILFEAMRNGFKG